MPTYVKEHLSVVSSREKIVEFCSEIFNPAPSPHVCFFVKKKFSFSVLTDNQTAH